MAWERDWTEEHGTYSSDAEVLSGNFQGISDATSFDDFEVDYATDVALVDALPESTSAEGAYKAEAYDALYAGTIDSLVPALPGSVAFAGNWASWLVGVDVTLPDGTAVTAGQLVYWFGDAWYVLDPSDEIVDPGRNYLQALVTRLFGPEVFDNYPDFVDLCIEFLKWLDSSDVGDGEVGPYYLLQQMDKFFDIDRAPDFVLQDNLLEVAPGFGTDDAFGSIPYFNDVDGTDFDSVRHFARIARKWTQEKGTLPALFVMFRMLLSRLRVRLAWKMVLRGSSYIDEHTATWGDNGSLKYTPAEETFNYEGMRDGDTDVRLVCHAHGVEQNVQVLEDGTRIRKDTDGRELENYENDATWGAYSLVLDTDADIEKFSKLVEDVWKVGGVAITWRKMPTAPTSFGSGSFGDVEFGGL